MLRRNGPVVKSMESVLRLEGSLWGERFVEEVGLEPGVKERGGVMDGESGELTEWEEVVGEWTGRTETEGVKWGWRRELGSWFQRQGEAYRKERLVMRREDDVVLCHQFCANVHHVIAYIQCDWCYCMLSCIHAWKRKYEFAENQLFAKNSSKPSRIWIKS